MGASTRENDHQAGAIATAALLADGVRRRIFQFVRRARRPVTRDEAAASAHVSRNLAAFHLEKLVETGLLRSRTQPAAAARVGRRPKVYEAGPVEVNLDVPQRQHALLAGVLVEALAADEAGRDVRWAAVDAARRRGGELGRRSLVEAGGRRGAAEVEAVLELIGFEPYEAEPAVLRLANCPFHPLAAASPDLVCGLNHGLIAGVLAGMEVDAMEAVLAPRAGECCVEVRTRLR